MDFVLYVAAITCALSRREDTSCATDIGKRTRDCRASAVGVCKLGCAFFAWPPAMAVPKRSTSELMTVSIGYMGQKPADTAPSVDRSHYISKISRKHH